MAAQLVVREPWVRSTVPGQKVAGAFMKLESPAAASLVGGSSPAARAVEIHETVMDGNIARMRPVARIEVSPGKPAELKPGGLHVMLIDIVRPLAKGDRVPLSLVYEAGGQKRTLEISAEVRDVMAPRGHHGKH
ncbi:MAG: copper chaperone PCu(A)C [Betaproteobacteria bacterium]